MDISYFIIPMMQQLLTEAHISIGKHQWPVDFILVGHISQLFTSLVWDLCLQQVTVNRLNITAVLRLKDDKTIICGIYHSFKHLEDNVIKLCLSSAHNNYLVSPSPALLGLTSLITSKGYRLAKTFSPADFWFNVGVDVGSSWDLTSWTLKCFNQYLFNWHSELNLDDNDQNGLQTGQSRQC